MAFINGLAPWEEISTDVKRAKTSEEVIALADLDWDVLSVPIFDERGRELKNYRANLRSTDRAVLGVTTKEYTPINNRVGFDLTNYVFKEGATYESAGASPDGKKVWITMKLPQEIIVEENIDPYLVFMNQHDGKGAMRVAMTPIRVVCQNMLNLSVKKASKKMTVTHKGNTELKLEEAHLILANTEKYLKALTKEFETLKLKKVTESQVKQMTEDLLKEEYRALYANATKDFGKVINIKDLAKKEKYEEKLARKRNDILEIYYDKPDLRGTEHTAFRFVNAVSDYATHTTDHNNREGYQVRRFLKSVDGLNIIETAHKIVLAA